MESNLTEAEFAVLAGRTGITFRAEQLATLREGYSYLVPLLQKIRPPRERAAEPGHIFIAGPVT